MEKASAAWQTAVAKISAEKRTEVAVFSLEDAPSLRYVNECNRCCVFGPEEKNGRASEREKGKLVDCEMEKRFHLLFFELTNSTELREACFLATKVLKALNAGRVSLLYNDNDRAIPRLFGLLEQDC